MTTADGEPQTSIDSFRRQAKELLPPEGWAYYDEASGRGSTQRESLAAFDRYVIRPRILRDVSHRSLTTTILGHPISMPICVGPAAEHRFAHREAEVATARGVADADTLMVLSCFANASIADVARSSPGGLRWMQLYLFSDRRISEHVVREAEKAGFKAIVLTVDLPLHGDYAIFRTSKGGYYTDPKLRPSNLAIDTPEVRAAIRSGDINIRHYLAKQFGSPKTWDDVRWLTSITSLPIVFKGVLTAEAAREAADAGVAGIIVSAHGGRHMDGIPAPMDALTEVVEAVKGRGVEVYMDGGVRSGSDILKALGLGARVVFIIKPVLWGLACDGSAGVSKVLSILRAEFDSALGISGCTSPHDIPPSLIARKSFL